MATETVQNGAYALIPAAGRGVRFGSPENKVFAPLLGRPLLGWTLQAFADCPKIEKIILIGSEGDLPRLREIGEQYGGGKLADVVLGGATRQESVYRGLLAVPETVEYVVVHDAARCCVPPVDVLMSVQWLRKFDALAMALPVTDTLVRGENVLPNHPDTYPDMGEYVSREGLWAMQTPQAFRLTDLLKAHETAIADGFAGTDDAGLVRRLGIAVQLVLGSAENIKVTQAPDLRLAKAILMSRTASSPTPAEPTPSPDISRNSSPLPESSSDSPLSRSEGGAGGGSTYGDGSTNGTAIPSGSPIIGGGGGQTNPPFRIGHGYDVHQFAEGRELWLGGVHFPESPKGLLGHSDADALLHAVCDALLGAAGMGDIGKLFPPSDMRHKDRPSIEFLEEVKVRLDDANWQVANIDITVIAEFPKIGPRSEAIKQKIAVCIGVDAAQISVKATTNETMGFVGRGEGIAVHATALLFR